MSGAAKASKTISQINERIRKGKAVVLNASEMVEAVKSMGKAKAAREVDVVTTGTFSPMCSSGMLFNIGQEPPLIKVQKMRLNNVPCHAGLAAVDAYLGVTELRKDDPLNKIRPGRFKYGGGHVIEDLVRGRAVSLWCESYGTDCYPKLKLEKEITLADLPYAQLFNPRNCYQSYNVAVNMTSRTIYTYMGPLKPNLKNANFATAGELSPLFNDPFFRTIGLGTKIFLGGGEGYVLGSGTQHNPRPKRSERGLPLHPAGTLMVRGDLKQMQARWLRGVSFLGYGSSLSVGVGIPIPVLDEDMAFFTGVADADITMPVVDYGHDYPNGVKRVLAQPSYAELMSGEIRVNGESVPTTPLTSRVMSLEIADALKERILSGAFLLTEPQERIVSV